MIPEFGLLALIAALLVALVAAIIPLWGAQRGYLSWMALGRPLAWVQFMLVVIAFVCLCWSFLSDDFSVRLVVAHSSLHMPVIYKFCAAWGNHEGSLLLWILLLSVWMAALERRSKHLPNRMRARALAVMALVSCGFISFSLLTSNPFLRHLPFAPEDGGDLNPLLQDAAMAMHPPLLYAGYVGFSVAFAFAIAALLEGGADARWARWARPWTNAAWALLTVGIALGSWWAYYELGWGGWWFWDPVENASFMPWLLGTALIHSLIMTERRGVFPNWSLLLAIFVFALSLLGTFLVRSGVLTSVHAFATDPTRGVYVLCLLVIFIGGSLLLFAFRAPFNIQPRVRFALFSREGLLLFNNLALVAAALVTLIGTLFPLAADALGLGKYSVGPPYFNALFVPLMLALMALMLLLPLISWGGERPRLSALRPDVLLRKPRWGMMVAHLGLFCCAAGVIGVSLFEIERDVRLKPGDSAMLGDYRFRYRDHRQVSGPNYQADELVIDVLEGEQPLGVLFPQKRNYNRSGQVMTEAAIIPGLWRDLYASLGEEIQLEEPQRETLATGSATAEEARPAPAAWSMRLRYKPMVRWIWLGAVLMAAGALIGLVLRRSAGAHAS